MCGFICTCCQKQVLGGNAVIILIPRKNFRWAVWAAAVALCIIYAITAAAGMEGTVLAGHCTRSFRPAQRCRKSLLSAKLGHQCTLVSQRSRGMLRQREGHAGHPKTCPLAWLGYRVPIWSRTFISTAAKHEGWTAPSPTYFQGTLSGCFPRTVKLGWLFCLISVWRSLNVVPQRSRGANCRGLIRVLPPPVASGQL